MPLRSNRLVLVNLILLASGAAEAAGPRTDAYGDPLPAGALARLGTMRYRVSPDSEGGVLSPDGKFVAVIRGHERICLIDTATGKEQRHFPCNRIGRRTLIFSPDGKLLAMTTSRGLYLYDVSKGDQVALLETTGGDRLSTAFSADGRRVAMGGESYPEKASVSVWDARGKKKLASWEVIHHQARVALSADGKILASWGHNTFLKEDEHRGTIQLWDTATGKEIHRVRVDTDSSIDPVAFAPDGKRLAVALGNGETISILDTSTGKQVRRLAARRGSGVLLRYSPDGKMLVAGSPDGVVQVWDTVGGKRIALCAGPKCGLTSVEFLPGGKMLAAGFIDQSLCLWEVPSGKQRSVNRGHSAAVGSLTFSPDGKTLLSTALDGVRIWDAISGKAVRHIVPTQDLQQRYFGRLAYLLSPDGRFLIAADEISKGLQVLDVASNQEICTLESDNPSRAGGLPAAFSADGVTVATLGMVFDNRKSEMVVRVWDLRTGQEIRSAKTGLGETQMSSLTLSPDGKVLAVASNFSLRDGDQQECRACLWNVASGKEVCKISHTGGWITTMAFSPDGALLATGERPGAPVRLWGASSGAAWHALEGPTNQGVFALAFSPDGRTLAAALSQANWENPCVRLWELASGKVRADFIGHQGIVHALAFSPDGRMLATGGDDTTILFWDVTGRGSEAAEGGGQLSAEVLARLWSDLDGADARRAHRAMARLAAAPAECLVLFRKHLTPDTRRPPEPVVIERLIADLDADQFAVRQKAARELAKAGKAVRPALVKALEAKPALEKKRRLEELVRTVSRATLPPEMLRPLRAVEVLERLATPEARRLLESLSRGNPDAPLTADARAALWRLSRRP